MTAVHEIEMTAEIVAAFLSTNPVNEARLPEIIRTVHTAVKELANPVAAPTVCEEIKPAVPIKKSVHTDKIFCLECGAGFKSLKRHLNVHHSLLPKAYRTKFSLPDDYPMVAPEYAAQRSSLAKATGLGNHRAAAKAA